MSVDTQIMFSVAGILRNTPWSQTIEVREAFLPDLSVEGMTGYYVTVVPRTRARERISRGDWQWIVEVDIAVQTCVSDPNDLAAVTAALDLAQSFQEHFDGAVLANMPEAICINTKSDPIYLPTHLRQAGVVTSIITCEFSIT